jgi:hypothetical protein
MAGLPKSEAVNLFLIIFLLFYFSNAVRCKHADRLCATYTFLQNPLIVEYFETLKSFCYRASYILTSKTFKVTADRVGATYTFLQNPLIVEYFETLKSFCYGASNNHFSKTLKGHADSLRILTQPNFPIQQTNKSKIK